MNKLCKILISSLCIISNALVLDLKPVPQKAMLKGHLEAASSTGIQLPFDVTLTPLVPFNAEVTAGEPLFQIDAQTARPMLLKTIHGYLQATEKLNIQQRHTALQSALLELEVVSQKEAHESMIEFESKQSELLEKRGELSQILSYYQKTIEDIENLPAHDILSIQHYIEQEIPDYIIAPASGVFVSGVDKPAGKNPMTYPKNKTVASVLNRNKYELSLMMTASQANQIHKAQKVTVKIQDTKAELEGTVTAIGAYPSSTQGRREYAVTIALTAQDTQLSDSLRIGMAAAVNLTLSEKEALMIPLSYVKQSFGRAHQVMVKGKNNITTLREVTLGQTHDNEIEVLSGLEKGEEIIEHH